MSDDDRKARLLAVREPPPPLEPVTLIERTEVSPRLLRLRLEGDVLRRLDVPQVAMSVRLRVLSFPLPLSKHGSGRGSSHSPYPTGLPHCAGCE